MTMKRTIFCCSTAMLAMASLIHPTMSDGNPEPGGGGDPGADLAPIDPSALSPAPILAPVPIELEPDAETAASAAQAEKLETIAALSVDKLKAELGGLSLVELRGLFALEEGKAETRVGAIAAIAKAIDQHPDQIAALAAAEPATNEAAGPIVFADQVPALEDDEVRKLARVAILFARREFAYPELAPHVLAGGELIRAGDGRTLVDVDLHVAGIGLETALPLEEAWLVDYSGDEPTIVRRCEIPSAMTLVPGMRVKFQARSLIF